MKWWNKKYGKEQLCGITHCRLRPGKNRTGESLVVFLHCGHGFYRSALKNWVLIDIDKTPTCPLCRKEFCFLEVFI